MEKLLLASSSPRRREILAGLGLPFGILSPETDESLRDGLPPRERVLALAEDKALEAASRSEAAAYRFVLAADTLVADPRPLPRPLSRPLDASGHLVLGKAANREDAASMMELLARRVHEVHTGLALLDRATGAIETIRSTSRVSFSSISPKELSAYLDSNEWEGVAGAYRIQGLAALYITHIEGSWSGIVGLPIHELYVILRRYGLDPSA